MKIFEKTALVLFAIFTLQTTAQESDNNIAVPFTLADRDRIMRTEQRLTSLEKSIDERFDAMQKSNDIRFSTITNLLYILLASIFGLVGFVFWDRRSYLKPFKEQTETANLKINDIIESLREKAKKDPELASILRMNNLL